MTHVPLKRLFAEKRHFVVPVLAGLALNIVLYAGVVYPMRLRVNSVERRAETAARAQAAAKRDHTAARLLAEGRDRTNAELRTLYQDVLPTSVAGARRITDLELAKLAAQHHLRRGQRATVLEEQRDGALARLRTTVPLHGSYEDIRQFIYALESGSAFLVIDSLSLVESSEPGSALTVSLGFSTYFRREHGA
jgi:Tfp pilus assembly protein PilO